MQVKPVGALGHVGISLFTILGTSGDRKNLWHLREISRGIAGLTTIVSIHTMHMYQVCLLQRNTNRISREAYHPFKSGVTMFRATSLVLLVFCVSGVNIAAEDDLAKDAAAAEAGDFVAMLRVGLAYLGDDDKSNVVDGIKWLEMSAAGGEVVAYYNLGAIYQDGEVVKLDGPKALMYLTIAAELGEIRAMNRLAGIYYKGKLVPTNDLLAIKWGLCAAGLGSESAKNNMKHIGADVDERSKVLGAKAAEAWAKKRLGKKDKNPE